MKATMTCHQATHSVGFANEDDCRFTGSWAWMLDGATSISGRKRTIDGHNESDASWFVHRFSDHLEAAAPRDEFDDACRSALAAIRDEAPGIWGDFAGNDVPSASFSHVAVLPGEIRLHNLGDCRMLFRIDGGPLRSFGSCNVAQLDAELLDLYKNVRRENSRLTHAQTAASLVQTIRANRQHMNTPDGYWILDPTGAGLAQMQSEVHRFDRTVEVLLATDGLYRLVDTYPVHDDHQFFEKANAPGGLDALIDELRRIEAADPECLLYPRVKAQDDATGLVLTLRM